MPEPAAPDTAAIIFLVAILFLFMPSCRHQVEGTKKDTAPKQQAKDAQTKTAKPAKPVPDSRSARKDGDLYLFAGEYEKALDVYRAALSGGVADKDLRKGYGEAMGRVKEAADAAFEKQEFLRAGGFYYLLEKYYPDARWGIVLSFDAPYLRERKKLCAKVLTQDGLSRYREGKLETAIFIWDCVLGFDPGNAEVKKALDTAKIQLKNLTK